MDFCGIAKSQFDIMVSWKGTEMSSYRIATKAAGGPFIQATAVRDTERLARDFRAMGLDDDHIAAAIAYSEGKGMEKQLWRNDVYTVAVWFDDGITHLSIKRNDREALHDWRDLQEIKNSICGPEREAYEIYPAESRRVDSANQYHLWVLPAGERVPHGFEERFVVDAVAGTKAKQRPFVKSK